MGPRGGFDVGIAAGIGVATAINFHPPASDTTFWANAKNKRGDCSPIVGGATFRNVLPVFETLRIKEKLPV
jgi:hypothetical protein